MLYCRCGFSCGTLKALQRHVTKFALEGAQSQHYQEDPPPRLLEAAPTMAKIRDKFEKLDKDGNGTLSYDEMVALLRDGNANLTDKELRLLFNAADTNGDGVVEFDEFLSFLYMPSSVPKTRNKERPKPLPRFKSMLEHFDENRPLASLVENMPQHDGVKPSLDADSGRTTSASEAGRSGEEEADDDDESDCSELSNLSEEFEAGANWITEDGLIVSEDGSQSRRLSVHLRQLGESTRRVPPSRSLTGDDLTASRTGRSRGAICFDPHELHPVDSASPVARHELSETVRLLIIRHAESGNKKRAKGQPACRDPGLTDLGHDQADALGRRIASEFRSLDITSNSVVVVSSPMRRCLLTIRPTIAQLGLPSDLCECHGGCFEYSCAGTDYLGTRFDEIAEEFPEFRPEGFSDAGTWDYRGSSTKESQQECRSRARRISEWLWQRAQRLSLTQRGNLRCTLMLCCHQTFADVLCKVLVEGSSDTWEYGDIAYRLHNAALTEIFLHPDGHASLGKQDDHNHIRNLKLNLRRP